MIKKQYIDLIQHKLAGGNITPDLKGKYHSQIISKHIEITLNDLYKEIFYKNISDLDFWAKTFWNVPVEYQATTDVYYSDLPSAIVQLPRGRAIRRVSPMQSPEITFKQTSDNARSVLMRLDVATVGTETWYTYGSDRIEYFALPAGVSDNGVLMKLVIPFSSYDNDDEFVIPSGYNDFLIETVYAKLMNIPPEDDSNDSNSKRIWNTK